MIITDNTKSEVTVSPVENVHAFDASAALDGNYLDDSTTNKGNGIPAMKKLKPPVYLQLHMHLSWILVLVVMRVKSS